eukprot:8690628-Ditylum_brightwellii.AAC.1
MSANTEHHWCIDHMNRHQGKENLTRQAELNNVADALATCAKENMTQNKHYLQPTAYPSSQVNVYINNKIITCNNECKIQQAFTSRELREYMEEKLKWHKLITNTIDWEMHRTNLIRLGYYQHKFIAKLIHKCLSCLVESFSNSVVTI